MGSSGRSSGGGGSSGDVDYPEYQKVVQADWLAGGDHNSPGTMARLDPGNSITELINLAVQNSPYEEAIAYDPSSHVNQMLNAVREFLPQLDKEIDSYLTYVNQYLDQVEGGGLVSDIEEILADTDLEEYFTKYRRDGTLDRLMMLADDFRDNVNPELYYVDGSLDQALSYVRGMDTSEHVENELAQFNQGMREINAVHSSAFGIGNRVVAAGFLATKAQLQADLGKAKSDKMFNYVQLKASTQQTIADIQAKVATLQDEKARSLLQYRIDAITKLTQLNLQDKDIVAKLGIQAHSQVYQSVASAVEVRAKLMVEARRMAIVAFKEEAEENLRIDTKDALWSVETFQGAANVMASIAGGTVTTTEEPGSNRGALGGALSGAASGAMIGGQVSGQNPYGYAIGAIVGGIGGAMMS